MFRKPRGDETHVWQPVVPAGAPGGWFGIHPVCLGNGIFFPPPACMLPVYPAWLRTSSEGALLQPAPAPWSEPFLSSALPAFP